MAFESFLSWETKVTAKIWTQIRTPFPKLLPSTFGNNGKITLLQYNAIKGQSALCKSIYCFDVHRMKYTSPGIILTYHNIKRCYSK